MDVLLGWSLLEVKYFSLLEQKVCSLEQWKRTGSPGPGILQARTLEWVTKEIPQPYFTDKKTETEVA